MSIQLSRRGFLASAAVSALAVGMAGVKVRSAFAAETAGLDAISQARLVARGEATSLDLVNAAIDRIEAVNPKVNAVVTETFDAAREKAAKGALPESPLSGVPYLIKDLDDVKGVRTTHGSRLMAKTIAKDNSAMTTYADEAGLVILGKTNTPEFGLLATTESLLLGPAHNPWGLDHSTGGSSGGAAAAVASGMLPVAHATDGGGSIRIPASCCGVFGLKPSRGRMDLGGRPMPGDIGVQNCVSRSVRDSAMVFSLSEDRSDKAVFKPVGYVSEPVNRKLKIGFGTANYFGEEPDPEVKAALESTAKLCADLGHEIVEVKNPLNGEEFITKFLTVWASGPAQLVAMAKEKGLDPNQVLEPWTVGLAEFYAKKPKDAMQTSLAYFKQVEAQMDKFMSGFDVWLTPVLSSPPPKLGQQAPTVPFDTLYERTVQYVAYTPVHNVAGTPAMSVPLSWSKAGLPIGSQFAARKGQEGLLYALALQLEQARPWADKHAPVFAG